MRRIALALMLFFACAGRGQAFDPLTAAGIDRRQDAQVPMDLALTDQSGQPTRLRNMAAGKPVLLVPVQYDCPNICGVTLAGLLQAVEGQRLVAGKDFTLVAFGIDPKETPQDAKRSLARLSAQFPSVAVHGLTGSDTGIAAMTQALGYRYSWDPALRQYDHVAAVAVLTPDGRLSNWLYGVAPASRDVQLALVAAGAGRIGRWTDQLLLLCYHYDPVSGRYTPVIWTMLQLLGAAVLAGGLSCLGHAVLRERRATGSARR